MLRPLNFNCEESRSCGREQLHEHKHADIAQAHARDRQAWQVHLEVCARRDGTKIEILCWLERLLGLECQHLPQAQGLHRGQSATSDRVSGSPHGASHVPGFRARLEYHWFCAYNLELLSPRLWRRCDTPEEWEESSPLRLTLDCCSPWARRAEFFVIIHTVLIVRMSFDLYLLRLLRNVTKQCSADRYGFLPHAHSL